MSPDKIKLSKFISLILRHKPQTIGVEMDVNGWVKVDDLINGINKAGSFIDMDLLKEIVATNNKTRFAFNEDFTKIRANQGHTLELDMQYQPANPPEVLYHGTAVQNIDSIRQKGLHRGKRFYVHLSEDVETAKQVGRRYGKPVVLIIKSGEMHKNNFIFHNPAPGLWLTSDVPAQFISFPED